MYIASGVAVLEREKVKAKDKYGKTVDYNVKLID